MTHSLHEHDPLERFAGLAEVYSRCRPDYPAEAIRYVITTCGLGPTSLLLDVGCGTGISSRLFAAQGIPVLGIEPNSEMRQQAEKAEWPHEDWLAPGYRAGQAEAIELLHGVADVVLAAQAFHWFQPDAALKEFHRVLKPGGWVVLMWNERDETDPFTKAYGDVIRTAPDTGLMEKVRGIAGEVILTCPLFPFGERVVFSHEQILTEEGVIGRALSVSYAPKKPEDVERYCAGLREVFALYQRVGLVKMKYQTTIYLGKRE